MERKDKIDILVQTLQDFLSKDNLNDATFTFSVDYTELTQNQIMLLDIVNGILERDYEALIDYSEIEVKK